MQGDRLKGPDLESESEGNASGFEGADEEDGDDEFDIKMADENEDDGEDERESGDTGDEMQGLKGEKQKSKKNTSMYEFFV